MNQPMNTIGYQPNGLGAPSPAFRFVGYGGFALAFVQSMFLAQRPGISRVTLLGITGVVILTFSALTMATKIIVGKELIIYYHHEIAVLAMTALFLRLTGQTVLPYLDVTTVGLGLFLACGRIGCLMVGCCHGRPSSWGIVYRNEHVQSGFPEYLAGVRLFPIQAVESLFAFGLVATGITVLLKGYTAGTAFGLYVLLYALARFFFEFARGDAVRPYLWSFSEAQWTSLLLAALETLAEHAQLVPRYRWHICIPLLLLSSMLIVTTKRRRDKTARFDLSHPGHIRQVAEAVKLADGIGSFLLPDFPRWPRPRPEIHVAETSLGIRLSSGEILQGTRRIRHYTLSSQVVRLSRNSARVLGRLIARLRNDARPFEVLAADRGVFHLLFGAPATGETDDLQPPQDTGKHSEDNFNALAVGYVDRAHKREEVR
jgi:Prolipoprotein diacylglyceryl transferase